MNKELKYNIIPDEDIEKVKKLGKRLSDLSIDYYMVEKDNKGYKFTPIHNRQFLLMYQDLKKDLESIVTLTYFFVKYCIDNGSTATSSCKCLENILYKPLKNIEYNELTVSSLDFEGVFKNLTLLLHIGAKDTREETWIQAIDKNYLSDFIEGTISIGKRKVKLVKDNDKKEGFIDPNDPDVNYIATTVRMYRNFLAHRTLPDADERLFYVNNDEEDNSTVMTAAKVFFAFLILLVRYRYDDILNALYDYIFKASPREIPSTEMSEEELEKKAIEILNKSYIPHAEWEQQSDLKAVYRFTGRIVDEEAKKKILNIRLKTFDDSTSPSNVQDNDNEGSSKGGTEFENIDILDRADSKIALLGESGTGKTTMLAQLTMELINRWKQSGEDEVCHLPIRINLANYGAPSSLQSYMFSSLLDSSSINGKEAEIVQDYIANLLKQGNVIILMDGLNEVKGDFSGAWKGICEFMEMYHECKFLMTSRIDDIRVQTHNLDSLYDVGYVVFQLCTLSDDDIRCQLNNALNVISGDTSSANSWFESIKRNENLVEMSKNPMQLMLLVNLLENGQEESLASMNPSRLYDSYIDDMLKYELLKTQKGSVPMYETKRMEFDNTLKQIARMVGTEMRSLSQNEIRDEYVKTLNADSNVTTLIVLFFEQLEPAIKMGLLCKKRGYYEFTHQSWIEFYRSMDYMEEIFEIMKNPDLSPEGEEELLSSIVEELFSYRFSHRAKYLKALLELIEWREEKQGTVNGQDRSLTIKCKFIMMILNHNQNEQPVLALSKKVDDLNGLSFIEGSEMPIIHNSLILLSIATSALKYTTPRKKDINVDEHTCYRLPPLYIVETSVLNVMYLYQQCYPSGEMDMKNLPDIFECAARCGTKRIAKELCSPYWLKMWVFIQKEYKSIIPVGRELLPQECKMTYPDDNSDCRKLADILTSKFRHPIYLCQLIENEFVFLRVCKMPKTASLILGQLLRLFDRIDDRRLREEHVRLIKLASNAGGHEELCFRTLANYALFMMEDADYISSNYNPDLKVDIHRAAMNHLFELSANAGIQKLLLKIVENNEKRRRNWTFLDKEKDSSLRILRFLLFSYPESNLLHEFLWDKSHAYILEQNPELVDILPIDKIPEDFIKAKYDVDIFNMMKLQHQEKEEQHHKINDFRKIYAESLEEGILSNEQYSRFAHLFHQVTEDKILANGHIARTQVAYSIYGRPNNQTLVLSCEGLSSGDKMSKKYCRLDGVDQWFMVDSNSPATGFFAELRFSGVSSGLSFSGIILLNVEDESHIIPYSYIIRRDEYFVLRVTDVKGLEILDQLQTKQNIMADVEVVISGQIFKLHEISFYSHPAQNNERTTSSLLRVHAISSELSSNLPVILSGGIPSSGYVSFYSAKDSIDSPLLLKVSDVSRGKTALIEGAIFWGNNKGYSMYVVGHNQYISRGSYVKITTKQRIGRVSYTAYINKSWKMKFVSENAIPSFGYLYLNDQERRIHYWVQSVKGHEYTMTIFIIGQEEYEATSIADKITSVTIDDVEYKVSEVTINTHPKHTYDLLWGMSGEMDLATGQKVGMDMELMFYQPVFNGFSIDILQKEQPLYHINKVKYRYDLLEGHRVLIVPHFISEKKKLYYKLGNSSNCHEVNKVPISYEEKRKVAIWDIDTIDIPKDVDFDNKDIWEGFLYFYSDPDGKDTETVGIRYMSSLISENEPGLYHASICTRYLEECKEKGLGNADIFRFFQSHNRSYEYLNYYLEQSDVWRKNHGAIYPCVGSVVSANASGVTVFSPSRENLIITEGLGDFVRVNLRDYGKVGRIYTENKQQNYTLQDLVVCEDNHSITHLNIRNDQRFEMLGYHYGIVTRKYPDGHGFLTSRNIQSREGNNIVFYFVASPQTASFAIGDIVTFMPSIHLGGHHNGEPLASGVLKVGSQRRPAEITHIEHSVGKDGSDLIVFGGVDINSGKRIIARTHANPPKDNEWLVRLTKLEIGANVVYIPVEDKMEASILKVKIVDIEEV